MEIHNMDDICRVCLYDGPNFNNLFEHRLIDSKNHKDDFVEDPTLTFDVVLEMLTTVKVAKDDGMPQRICNDCEERFLDAYLLRQQAERSNQSLLAMKDNDPDNTSFNIVEDVILVSTKQSDSYVEVYNVKTVKEPLNISSSKFTKSTAKVKMDMSENDIILKLDMEDISPKAEVDVDAGDNDDEEDAVSFLLASHAKQDANALKAKPKKKQVAHHKVHECSVCNKTFSRKSNLVDHLRLHANMRPYECDVCKATFVQSGNLKAHMRIHTKERPYECSICGKSYNQSGALKVHIRIHTNERNYTCDTCNKAFTNASDRNKHARVHDEKLQFGCDFCAKSFAQRVNWKLHMNKHHSDEMAETDLPKVAVRSLKSMIKKE